MAKRLKEIHIDSVLEHWTMYVYVDSKFDKDILKIEGVRGGMRILSGYLTVHVDPRYDFFEVEREIIELCR